MQYNTLIMFVKWMFVLKNFWSYEILYLVQWWSTIFPFAFFSNFFFYQLYFFFLRIFLLHIFLICLSFCKQYIVLFHSIIILKILFTFTLSFGWIVFFILKFLFMQTYIPYTHSDGINISSVKQMWLTKKL